jgi:hypothetical protein
MQYQEAYVDNPWAAENVFHEAAQTLVRPPTLASVKHLLPEPVWDGHDGVLECYWLAWELALKNTETPKPEAGFISSMMNAVTGECLSLWHSSFEVLFGRYGQRAFPFQNTLDNFYAKQHPDGYICRSIHTADGSDCFHRFNPVSAGANILPWCEWDYYRQYADIDRLARIFPAVLAYHHWLSIYRTWPDGACWSVCAASGMDNQPRVDQTDRYHKDYGHAHMTWSDACFQQVLSARFIDRMATVLNRRDEISLPRREAQAISALANGRLWDDRRNFYFDSHRDGSLSGVQSAAAFWALLADVVPPERVNPFVAHLTNPEEFNTFHRVPTLCKQHPDYHREGDGWLGSVVPAVNYMILRGLEHVGKHDLAHAIALDHLRIVVEVLHDTGTLWESYAPEESLPAKGARPDFVGWTGLTPIAVLFEHIFGIQAHAHAQRLIWDIRLLDHHGIRRYPFGAGTVDLLCHARASVHDMPVVEASSDVPLDLEIRWGHATEVRPIGPAS